MAKAKVDAFVDKLNVEREKKGMDPISLQGRNVHKAMQHANQPRPKEVEENRNAGPQVQN